jgi:hypothetical protein
MAQLEDDVTNSLITTDKVAVYVGQGDDEDDAYNLLVQHCNGDYTTKVGGFIHTSSSMVPFPW